MKIKLTRKDALVVVDVQNDFLLGGSLPVPNGATVIPVLNNYLEAFQKLQATIFATRDWHPINHISFKEYGGAWPPHCIRETEGAKFHPELIFPKNLLVISKATDPYKEAYSGFDGTNLLKELQKRQVLRIFIGGLATEYCVKNTVLDAITFGFESYLLADGSRGIDANPGDIKRSLEVMQQNGAKKVTSFDFIF